MRPLRRQGGGNLPPTVAYPRAVYLSRIAAVAACLVHVAVVVVYEGIAVIGIAHGHRPHCIGALSLAVYWAIHRGAGEVLRDARGLL